MDITFIFKVSNLYQLFFKNVYINYSILNKLHKIMIFHMLKFLIKPYLVKDDYHV